MSERIPATDPPSKPAPLPESVRRQMIACHCQALCAWLESLATKPQPVAPQPAVMSTAAQGKRRAA